MVLILVLLLALVSRLLVGRRDTVAARWLLRVGLRGKDGAETETFGAQTREKVGAVLVGVGAVVLLVARVHRGNP